jgi:DNA invertase Pin-like site-specific DNA recombinase
MTAVVQSAVTTRLKRAAVYSRVSTRDKGQEPENQLLQLRQLCQAQGWEIGREYVDHESGGTSERAQFQAMLRDASQRMFDLLVFWSLDRFTREETLATLRYLELLESYGIRWRSFTEPWIDSAGPFRDVVISLLASLAKQERIRLGERVKAGLERVKLKGTRSGKPVGRPRVVFDRGRAAQLRAQGWSWGKIAREMKVTVASVRRAYQTLGEGQQLCQKPQE